MGAKDPVNDAPAMGDDCPEHLPHNIDFRKETAEDFADPVPFTSSSGSMCCCTTPIRRPLLELEALRLDLQLRGIIAFREIDSSALRRRVIVEA